MHKDEETPPRRRVTTQVRLPADVHASLIERTTTNDLSLNETIVRMLRYALGKTGEKVVVKTTHTEEWTV